MSIDYKINLHLKGKGHEYSSDIPVVHQNAACFAWLLGSTFSDLLEHTSVKDIRLYTSDFSHEYQRTLRAIYSALNIDDTTVRHFYQNAEYVMVGSNQPMFNYKVLDIARYFIDFKGQRIDALHELCSEGIDIRLAFVLSNMLIKSGDGFLVCSSGEHGVVRPTLINEEGAKRFCKELIPRLHKSHTYEEAASHSGTEKLIEGDRAVLAILDKMLFKGDSIYDILQKTGDGGGWETKILKSKALEIAHTLQDSIFKEDEVILFNPFPKKSPANKGIKEAYEWLVSQSGGVAHA